MKGLGRVSRAKAGILAFIAGLFAAQEFSAHRLSSEQNTRKGIKETFHSLHKVARGYWPSPTVLDGTFFFFGLVKTARNIKKGSSKFVVKFL